MRLAVCLFLVFLLSLTSFNANSQAVPFVNANIPNHQTLDQRSIQLVFVLGPLSGTTTIAQWSVLLDPDGAGPTPAVSVPVTGLSVNSVTYFASINPTATQIFVQFDASGVAGHGASAPYLLPGETLTVSFVNTLNTLTTSGSGLPVANFGPISSKNNYQPAATGAGDILFQSEGIATALDQCSPVNTDYWRWTYLYSLRFRNSTRWVTNNNQLSVNWGSGAPVSNIPGYLSNSGGDPSPTQAPISITSFPGSAPGVLVSFRTGLNLAAAAIGNTVVDGSNQYIYPDNTDDCNFQTTHFPIGVTSAVYSASGSPTLQRQTQFNSFDYDNQNTGTLNLNPTVVNSDQVCLGTNVSMTFTDASIFNCRGDGTFLTPATGANPATSPINNQQRWVRIIYGGANSTLPANNIPNVQVGVVPVPVTNASGALLPAYAPNPILAGEVYTPQTPDPNPGPTIRGYVPTGAGGIGVPDANGVIQLPANATAASVVSQLITTSSPAGQIVGQRFYVTLQYWGVCNPYPSAEPVEISADFVEIVPLPAPPVATNQTVCQGTTPSAFSVTGVPALATANFYRNNNGVPGTLISTDNTSPYQLPINNYAATATDSLQVGTPGYYKVWVSYTPGIVGGVNCETVKIPVTIIIRPTITTPGAINGPTQVCNDNSTQYDFGETADSPIMSPDVPWADDLVGGPTFYTWSWSNNSGISAIAPSGATNKDLNDVIFNLPAGDFGGSASISRNLQINSRYTSGTPVCTTSPNVTKAVTIFRPTLGGAVTSPTNTICEGSSTATMTLSGHRGTILRWQRKFNADPYEDIANTTTTFSQVPPYGAGTYLYRAVIQNGACTFVNSTDFTLTVNPIPGTPTITETGASDGLTICLGESTILQSNNPGGLGVSYNWFKIPDLVTPVQAGASSTLTLTTIAQSGDYRVQLVGVATSNCLGPLSAPVTVTISGLPSVTNVTGGGAACDGNPAPDMIFTFSGAATYDFTIDRPGALPDVVETNYASNTYTLSGQTVAGNYQIIAISNSVTGCVGTVFFGAATVTSSGGAPAFDAARILTPTEACDDGGATTNPSLIFSLVDATSASTGPFIFTYTIDGAAKPVKNFNTDAVGTPTAALVFSDAELNNVGPHTIRIVSIQSPTGCFSLFNEDISFTVNARPVAPTSNGNVIACADVVATTPIAVVNPGAGFTIDWFAAASGGAALLAGNSSFTPGVAGTYHAETRNTTTGCVSTSRTAVILTSDARPANPVTIPVAATCSDVSVLTGNAATNGGTGTWTIGTSLYYETFSTVDNGLGITGPGIHATSFTRPGGKWTVTVPTNNTFGLATEFIRVNGGALVAQDVNNAEVVWLSEVIDISTSGNVYIGSQAAEYGVQAAGDYIRLFYKINGGAEVQFAGIVDDQDPGIADNQLQSFTSPLVSGNTLQIVARIRNNAAGDGHRLDNVFIAQSGVNVPIIADVNNPTSAVTNLQDGPNVFTWTITSALGACTLPPAILTITKNPQPITQDITFTLCETTFGTLDHLNYDLTTHDLAVANGDLTNRAVTWFTNPILTAAVPDATDVTVSNGDVFYARVENTLTGCTNVTPILNAGSVTFTVNPLPATNDQVFEICEETVGSADKDNNNLPTLFNDLVTGIPGSTNRTITWFIDPGVPVTLPSDLVTLVPTPGDVDDVTDGERFYAVVENTLTGCEDVAFVEFDIRPRPAANPISGSASVCAGTNIILYQIGTVVPGSTYSWNLPPDGAGFVRFAGGGPNDFFVLLQFPSVLTPPNDSYNISVTETSPNPDACTGVANSLTITVETSPSPNPIIGPNPVCKTETEVYQVTTIDPLNTYQWSITAGDAAIVGPASGTGLGSITVDFGTSASSTIRVVEQSPTGCSIAGGQTLVVNANDQPTMSSPATATVCSNLAVSTALNFVATIPLSTFNWQVINVTGTVSGTALGNSGSGDISQTIVNTTGGVASVTYRVTPTSPDGCQGPFQDVVVSITPQPVIVAGQAPIACSGEPVNREIFLTPLNQPVATIFDWPAPVMSDASAQGTAKNVAAGIAGTFHITDVLVNLSNAPITATYTVTPSNGLCNGAPQTVVVTVNPEPIGVDDNTPNICSNGIVNYSLSNNITTLGNNLIAGTTYSWIANANPNVTGESLVAQGGATITDALRNITSTDQVVVYVVTPTSSLGCIGNTFTISVTVRPEPVATNDVSTICSDSPLTYNLQNRVNLSGNGLASTFSWVAVSNPNVTGESTAVQNTGVITDVLNNVTNTDQVVIYAITPVGTNGCVGSSFTLTVTVRPEPVGADDSFTTCSDVALSYNLTSNVTTLGNNLTASFSWVAAVNGNVTGESTTPQAGNIINNTLTNISNSNQVVVYTVTPTGTNGCPGDDFTVTVTVQPEPRGIIDGPIDVCSNVAFNYSLQNNVNTLGNSVTANFTWSAAANGNVTGESTALQAGGTITDVLRNVTNSDELVTYTVTPTGTNGCLGNSFTVTFRVQPEPVGVNDIKTICSDAIVSVDLQDNVTSLGNNLTSNFSWQAAANGNVTGESTNAQASSIITDALSNNTNADQVVVYTVTPTGTNGCAGVPFTISVTVRPEPIGVNDVKTVCSDDNVAYDLLSNVTSLGNGLPATFSWVAASNPNVLGESTSAQAGSTITDVINNVTNADQVVVYTITPTASGSGCVGSSFTITVTVRPEPKGTNAAKTICSDANVAVDLQLNVNTLPGNSLPATFSWVAISNGNVSGESIVPQAGNTINDVLNNVTNADQVVVYTVTPTGTNGCAGNTFDITVTVRPEPLGVNASKSICSDENVNVDLQDNVTSLGNNLPATFSWIATPNASVSGESTLAQAGATINDVLTNLTGSDQVVQYTVTPTSLAGCPGNSFTVTITVQSEPNAPTGTGLICSDAAVNFNLQNHVISVGNGQTATFSWIATSNGSVIGESTSPVVGGIITDVLTNTSNADQVVRYTVTPTGTNGCIGNAFFVDITVRSEPRGANAPATTCSDVVLNVDLQNNISTVGNSQAATFSWVAAANGLVTGESLVPQASAFITDILTNKTGVDQTVVYTVTPTGTNGCVGDNFTITVTVQSEPTGDDDVVPICSDNNVNYDLQNNNVNVLGNSQAATFTWIAAVNPNVSGENTVLQTTSLINDVLNNVTGVNQTVVYTITPTGTNGCLGDVFTVSITVRPEPLGVNDTKTICSDNNVSYNLQDNINNLGNSLISNFTWVAAANANVSGESTIAVAGNVINDNLNNVTSIDQIVVYTVTPTGTNGCAGNSFTVQVTVQPEPQGIAGTKTICSDLSVNYNLQTDNINAGGNTVAATFSWIAASNPNVTGESTTGQNTGTITDILNNVTGIAQTVVYTVTPTGVNGCLGNDFTVTITVNPEPTGQNDTDTSCNVPLSYDIQASNINVFGNGVNSLFTYTVLSSDQINVPAGPDRLGANALPITDSYTNSTGSDVFMTYTITPISSPNGCPGNSFTYVVTIKSRPIGTSYTEAPNICSGVPFVVNPQTPGITNGVISTFTWTAAYAPGLTGGIGAGVGTIGETLSNVGAGPLSVIYTVTPSAGPCQGPDFDITVIIDPQPVTDPSLATKTICSDLISNILLNTNGISVGATNWDVDVVSVDANLLPNAGNATDPGLAEVANYIQNDRYTNVSFTPGNVIYKVTPIGPPATSCRGVDTFVTLTVNPEPVMNPALATPAPVCSDELIGVSLSTNGTSVAAASYIFASVSTFQAGNAAADPDETGPGDRPASVIQNDSYTNQTIGSFTRTYQIKPKSAAGCLGDFLNIPVQVLPEPDFIFTIPPPICSTDLIGLQLDTTPGSVSVDEYEVTSINWETIPAPGLLPGGSNIAIGSVLPAVAGSFTINDSYVNGQNVSLNATYAIRPYAPLTLGKRCVGDVKQAVVGIRPSPIVLEELDEIVCNDATNGILINTKASSAPANSFEIVRPALPAGLSLGSYAPGTSVVTGNSTTAIANDRFVNTTNNPIPVIYTVRANTDAVPTSGCFGPAEQVQVLVEPQIVVTLDATTNLKPDICGGSDMTNIDLESPSNPSAGAVTFNFTVSPSISGALPGSNLDETDFITQALLNTTNAPINVTYSITPRANSAAGGLGCVGILNTTVVSVRPSPKLTSTPANFTICEGEPLGVDFATTTTTGAGTSAVAFELIRVEDPNTAPAAPANGITGFNNVFPSNYAIGTDVLNDVLTNSNIDGLQHSIRYAFIPKYTITARAFECRGEESYVTVLVSPRASITGFDDISDAIAESDPLNLLPGIPVEVCSGEPFDRKILFTGADAGSTNLSWTRVADAGVTGSSGGAGDILSQVLFNATNTDVSQVTYTVTPKSFNCQGPPVNLVARVLPVAKIGTLASTFKICADGTFEVDPIPTNIVNANFYWVVDNPDPTFVTLQSTLAQPSTSISDTWLNQSPTFDLASLTYTLSPFVSKTTGQECFGTDKFVTVNVAPPIDAELFSSSGDEDAFICEDDEELLTFINNGLSKFSLKYLEDATEITVNNAGSVINLFVSPTATTTYTLLSLTDSYGCEQTTFTGNSVVTVNVANTNADFVVPGQVIACSPFPVDFEYNQQNGIEYTWRWADGEADSVYVAGATVANESVRHIFTNLSTSSTRSFKVELETRIVDGADLDNNYPGGCSDRSDQTVQVYPIVVAAVTVDTDAICSGETIQFRNSSRGVKSDTWFYRVQGSSGQLDVRNGTYTGSQRPPSLTSFTLENLITNPLLFEVVYQARNENCSAPDSVTTITVYRSMTADFNATVLGEYVGGHAFVNVTNTSSPIDAVDFTYEWNFGEDANPADFNGATPVNPLDYLTPGLKEISLRVTNVLAASNGLTCFDEIRKTISITVPPLVADFDAIPLAACFPTDITVTENRATGDEFDWEVIDEGGRTSATSNANLPVFAIPNPGKYTVFLTTRNSFTGDSRSTSKELEIFELPIASFEVRPTVVFIPDQEITTFNFSSKANQYEWDFGDGNSSFDFEPTFSYKVEGEYPVTLVAGFNNGSRDVDGDGVNDGAIICYDTLTRTIQAKEGGVTRVPNAFTPNPNGPNGGNGGAGSFNDVFLPITKGVEEFMMQIYDRWGNLVFESRDKNQGWDGYHRNGKQMPAGVYVFKLELRLSNGQRTNQVGDITLIR